MSYADAIDRSLPQYIAIGMTPDQYMNGPTALLKAYREAWRARLEHEDSLAWLNGLYAGRAVASVLVGKTAPYPDRPFGAKERESGEKGGEDGGMAYMDGFMAAFNRKRREREAAEKGAGEEG